MLAAADLKAGFPPTDGHGRGKLYPPAAAKAVAALETGRTNATAAITKETAKLDGFEQEGVPRCKPSKRWWRSCMRAVAKAKELQSNRPDEELDQELLRQQIKDYMVRVRWCVCECNACCCAHLRVRLAVCLLCRR